MSSLFECHKKILSTMLLLSVSGSIVSAQSPAANGASVPAGSFFAAYGLYLASFAVFVVVSATIVLLRKRAAGKSPGTLRNSSYTAGNDPLNKGAGNRTPTGRKRRAKLNSPHKNEPPATILEVPAVPVPKLPVFSFVRLERAPAFLGLPDSEDEDLLCAIEQTREGSEEDVEMRHLSLKILAAFKTNNSVEALSQMALYDLSSKLRSTAVSTLAQFDHESVFEAVITACADPTREVRAAAARGLFRLSFDRAHAWTRIIESNDLSRMRQAARAVIEGKLVERSFERLIHKDQNIAYEAYAITALLIRAGETEPIYRILAEHKDEDLKLTLLHVLQTIKNDATFDALSEFVTHHKLSANVAAKVNEVKAHSQELLSV
jgi:hypothetical protein